MAHYILDPLLGLAGLPVYLIVGALVFSEAAILVGFIFPGETAVLLGGVLASQGHVQLPVLIAVVVVAAVVGDSVGYAVGRRLGPRLLETRLLRRRRRLIDSVMSALRRRGAWVVVLGRFTAFLRAVVPGTAGMSGMHYPVFLAANFAGGLLWGVGFCVIGYVVGNAYRKVEAVSTPASIALLVLVVAVYVALAVRSRRRERQMESE